MAWGKRATDDLARIADALEKQNELMRLLAEYNDYRFKDWMKRKGLDDLEQAQRDAIKGGLGT